MPLVYGGFSHYRDMKKFLKNLLQNCWSDFEAISQEYSLSDPFQKLFAKFWSVYKYGYGEWGLFHYMDMKNFLKNIFLENRLYYRDMKKFLKRSSSQKLLVRFWLW